MRSEHRQWIAYSISVVLLLGLGFYLVATLIGRANAAAGPDASAVAEPGVAPVSLASHIAPAMRTAYAAPKSAPSPAVAASPSGLSADVAPVRPESVPLAAPLAETPPAPPVQEESKRLTYETTAYYLNVRKEPYPKAKIIDVLERGTIIEVLSTTDNGWLKLKDGGYVHGGYAKQLTAGVVRIASIGTVLQSAAAAAGASGNDRPEETPEDGSSPRKPSSKVESDSGLTLADIDTLLAGTELEDEGLKQAILDVEEKYGINAYFTIAVMKLESGNGSSKIARKKNNLFGLNAIAGDAYNQALSFKSKADCVMKFGQLMADKYVDKGYTTVDKVAKKYCPANSRWPSHVKDIMAKDYKLL